MKVAVSVSGCDADTELFIEMDADQYAFLQEVASLVSAASSYGCEPRMAVTDNSDTTLWRSVEEAVQERQERAEFEMSRRSN